MRDKWVAVSGSLILAAVAGGAFNWIKRSSPQEPTPVANAAKPTALDLSLPGKIQALRVVRVGATATGTIESFLADVGQDVAEGQLLAHIGSQGLESAREEAARTVRHAQERVSALESQIIAARLEASRLRADANRARDQLEQSEKTYLHQQMLNREGATPRLVYERSAHNYDTVRAEFSSLDEIARQAQDRTGDLIRKLEDDKRALEDRNAELDSATVQAASAEIRSPVDGVVVARRGERGRVLAPDEANDLFEIAVDLVHLAVEIQPGAAALKRIRAGQGALVFVADLVGAIPGSVKEVRTHDAVIELVSLNAVIRPGMPAQVRMKLE
jgi:multidrug resistance efflux pump